VKQVLRYIKQTLLYGFLLSKSFSSVIYAFSNADWAGCQDDRKSTDGFSI